MAQNQEQERSSWLKGRFKGGCLLATCCGGGDGDAAVDAQAGSEPAAAAPTSWTLPCASQYLWLLRSRLLASCRCLCHALSQGAAKAVLFVHPSPYLAIKIMQPPGVVAGSCLGCALAWVCQSCMVCAAGWQTALHKAGYLLKQLQGAIVGMRLPLLGQSGYSGTHLASM